MFKDKNVIITGSNRGIGKTLLEEFAKNGANIWACARTPNDNFEKFIQNLSQEFKIWIKPVYFDLSNENSIKEGFKQIYLEKLPIDILVNCAGVAHGNLFQMTPISKIKEVFEINLFEQMELTQLVLKIMTRQKRGSIINFSSLAAFALKSGNSAYGVSKAAVAAWTKTLAQETAKYNIRVNAVAPGLIDTDMAKQMEEKARKEMIESSAMKRLGKVTEVTDAVLFLASEKASFINGQIFRIDGGI